MNIKKTSKSTFNKLIEKACKGTDVSTRELHREFINYGYENFRDLNLTLDDLKAIVSDLSDSRETSTTHVRGKTPRSEVEAQY